MKRHLFCLFIVIQSTVLFTGCTLMWPIKMDSSDFSKIDDTHVSSLVLKNGETVIFDKEGGQYVRKVIKDTVYTGIVGYDLFTAKFVNFPLHTIASVQGEHKKVSILLTILAVIAGAFLLFVGILSFIFRNGAH